MGRTRPKCMGWAGQARTQTGWLLCISTVTNPSLFAERELIHVLHEGAVNINKGKQRRGNEMAYLQWRRGGVAGGGGTVAGGFLTLLPLFFCSLLCLFFFLFFFFVSSSLFSSFLSLFLLPFVVFSLSLSFCFSLLLFSSICASSLTLYL